MKNSLSTKIWSFIKEHLVTIGYGIIAGSSIVIYLFYSIHSISMNYCPLFAGVLCSWFVAVISTFVVLYVTYLHSDKKEEYKEIFRQSEKWLRGITIVVLFYMAIHLASKAFCEKVDDTNNVRIPVGIPTFGEPYAELANGACDKLYFLKYISPQDVILSTFVIFIIISIFAIAPYCIYKYKNIVPIFILISFALSCTIALFIYLFMKDPSIVLGAIPTSLEKSVSLKWITEPPPTVALSEIDLRLFFATFLVSSVLYILIHKITKIPKGCEGDFRDLLIVFCFLPSIIVASLVVSEDGLVRFPNICGHIVVGLLLISGFSTLVTLTTISFSLNENSYGILYRLALASLAAISFFSVIFLLIPFQEMETFRKILSFAVAVMIIILLYGFLYEKLRKYQFTEWWRREYRPIAMIISIVMIVIIGAMEPKTSKLVWIFIVLVFVCGLPWIIMGFRKLLKGQIPKLNIVPMRQGMVLVKAEPSPGKLKEVIKELDGTEGVYQTMVVTGEYDVCLIIEGVDSDDIAKKNLAIRKIKGVASTTTLTDIRESFDREVRYK